MRPLPVTVAPRDRESISGYVDRVARFNDVPATWICKGPNVARPRRPQLERIAEITGQTVTKLRAMSAFRAHGCGNFASAELHRRVPQTCHTCGPELHQQLWYQPWVFACLNCRTLLQTPDDRSAPIPLSSATIRVQTEIVHSLRPTHHPLTASGLAVIELSRRARRTRRRPLTHWPLLTVDAHRLLGHVTLSTSQYLQPLPWHPATTAMAAITHWPASVEVVAPRSPRPVDRTRYQLGNVQTQILRSPMMWTVATGFPYPRISHGGRPALHYAAAAHGGDCGELPDLSEAYATNSLLSAEAALSVFDRLDPTRP